MLSRLKRWWRNLFARHNRLWATQVVSSVAAVLLALAASWGAYFVAEGTFPDIERETLDDLLTVIASSMLAVTTFSLSIMVGAFGAAAGSATPRATPLLMADDGTRTAIAAFLSAFIYAVVAKIALGIGYYGANGRFILFLGTLAVLAWLLVTLVRWVRTLSSLGSMTNTLRKVEDVAFDTLADYWRRPFLGAARSWAPPPACPSTRARRWARPSTPPAPATCSTSTCRNCRPVRARRVAACMCAFGPAPWCGPAR